MSKGGWLLINHNYDRFNILLLLDVWPFTVRYYACSWISWIVYAADPVRLFDLFRLLISNVYDATLGFVTKYLYVISCMFSLAQVPHSIDLRIIFPYCLFNALTTSTISFEFFFFFLYDLFVLVGLLVASGWHYGEGCHLSGNLSSVCCHA